MKEFFDQFSIYITPIASLVTIAVAIPTLLSVLRKLNVSNKRLKREKIKSIISPIPNANNIISTLLETDYYIPVRAQEKEPNDSDSYTSSQPSIVDILIDEWRQMAGGLKRYIVWGGSGTGKTTFLAALVYKYIMSFKLGKEPYHIKVFTLNDIDNDLFTEIEKVDEQEKTILILDALDENFEANKDVETFMDKINKATRRFAIVVITSRQVFSKGEEVLKEIPILGLYRELRWKYYYILPFNDSDVQRYLNNKFKCPSPDYNKAINVVEKSSTLMSRAMVLSFIDDLLDLNPDSLTRTQLYKHIVDKWLYRELAAVHGEKNKTIYINNYCQFSSIIANAMYDNWQKNNKLSITQDELDNLVNEHRNLFPENYYPYKVRSLVERNNNDEYRFAHKSFCEFFLAIHSIENPSESFSPQGFDLAVQFSKEIYELSLEGKKFECVDYFEPHFIVGKSFLDPMVIDAFDRFKNIQNNTRKESLYIEANQLRIMLLQRLAFQYDTIMKLAIGMVSAYQSAKNRGDIHYVSKLAQLGKESSTIDEKLISITSDLQSLFIDNIIDDCRDILSSIGGGYNYIIKWMKESKEVVTTSSHTFELDDFTYQTKETLVLPYMFDFSDEFVKECVAPKYTYINISYGFNGDEEVCNALISLLRFKKSVMVSVYRKLGDIDNNVKFITLLVEKIKPLSTCPQHIILKLEIEDTPIFYVVDKYSAEYNIEQIRSCLTNMLTISKME